MYKKRWVLEDDLTSFFQGSSLSPGDTIFQKNADVSSQIGKPSRIPSFREAEEQDDFPCLSNAATKKRILSSDPGEELDDNLAYYYGILCALNGPFDTHILISGGNMNPDERLLILSKYINAQVQDEAASSPRIGGSEDGIDACLRLIPLTTYKKECGTVTFYRCGNEEDLRVLRANCACDKAGVFINNGPLCPKSLDTLVECLLPNAMMYLVGSSDRGRTGGINQNYGDKCWQDFLRRVPDSIRIDVDANVTRRLRFPNEVSLFPRGSNIRKVATRSAFTFIASRPTIPPKWAGLGTHVRINAGNAAICKMWIEECNLKLGPGHWESKLAVEKTDAYIAALKTLHENGGGKGDSVETVMEQFKHASVSFSENHRIQPHPNGGVIFEDVHWDALYSLALTCFSLTYYFADQAKCAFHTTPQPGGVAVSLYPPPNQPTRARLKFAFIFPLHMCERSGKEGGGVYPTLYYLCLSFSLITSPSKK